MIALFMALALQTSVASVPVAPDIAGAIEPQGAFTSDGRMIVAFGTKDTVYVAKESNKGPFDAPFRIEAPGLMIGMRRGPRIVVVGNNVLVTYAMQSTVAKFRANLFSVVSHDGGKTWGEKVRVNDIEGCAPEGLNGLCATPEGFTSVWLDHRGEHTEIWSSTSSKGSESWSKNVLVYRSPSGNVCECCHPSVVGDSNGLIHVMWRNSLDGNRDLYVCKSDDGQSFSNAQLLGTGRWRLNACPMDGGSIAVSQDIVRTVWRRERSVYYAELTGGEVRLDDGEQPTVTSDGQDVWLAWLSKRHGDLNLRKNLSGPNLVVSHDADDPVLFCGPKRKIGLVWTSPQGPRAQRISP